MGEDYAWIVPDDFAARINREWEKAKSNLKRVNVLITGKTGSGKSTLINAVFREKLADASIGAPVTKDITYYPREGTLTDLPLRIYDTKGLELGAAAQSEVMDSIRKLIYGKWATGNIEEQVHVVWYCINAGSARVEEVELQWINELCSLGESGIPVIVVITQSFRKSAADKLKKYVEDHISAQQYKGCYVVLAQADEDEPDHFPAFGLEELVKATLHVIPPSVKRAFINAQGVSVDLKAQAAKEILLGYIASATATGAISVPFSDAPLLIANEIAMCIHLTATFGVDLDKAAVAGIVTTLVGIPAATIAGKTFVSGILKLIPGAGTVLGGIVSGATAALLTAALGRVYIAVLEMIAKGEVKQEELGTDAFKTVIRDMMKKELAKKSTDD